MSFLRTLGSAVTAVNDLVRKATETASPYQVLEVKTSALKSWQLLCEEDCVSLYKDGGTFIAVLQQKPTDVRAFSLFRLTNETEAKTFFANLSYKTSLLCQSAGGNSLLKLPLLQSLVDTLKSSPTWTAAHLAAHLGLESCFKYSTIAQQLNTVDDETGMCPIHVAMEADHMTCVHELIILGASLRSVDSVGNTVFHYAAKTSNHKYIQYLSAKDSSTINQLNAYGESALHLACLHDRPDNVEHLLRSGANPTLTMSTRLPIHCAMKVASIKCAERLCHWSKEQINARDTKYGGTPLHWAHNRESVYMLVDAGCLIDEASHNGETPLHIMIQRNRVECIMALLTKGADTGRVCCAGNTALHMAIQTDDADIVQALIVFGAGVNAVNKSGVSVRHAAATHQGPNRPRMVELLHGVGARRCSAGMMGCDRACSAHGSLMGEPPVTTPEHERKGYDKMLTDIAMATALTRSASASDSNMLFGSDVAANGRAGSVSAAGDRLLSLDGGGIRGLILIQILMALEQTMGQSVLHAFDWIAGTSTGGILALAILHGKSLRYCQGLYFRLKDEVFKGKRPYDSEPFERFLKREFGECTRMSEKAFPRVMVTGVIGDCFPAKLHLFRNYESPCPNHSPPDPLNVPLPRPNQQFVWKAARSTGAAPTYFRAFERFLDGGVIANNPTLDLMTEVHEYNIGLRASSQGDQARHIHVVVSVGTGCIPTQPISGADVYRPTGIFDLYNVAMGAKNLTALLVDQATMSEGRPVERARAWCSMIGVPFFRFSPHLSRDIALDCNDDKVLIQMLWETQCYLHQHQDRLQQLATLLMI